MRCRACETENASSAKFCSECGSALATSGPAPVAPAPPPHTERRLVSVLLADLVGFATASEGRDAEDTRELRVASPVEVTQ